MTINCFREIVVSKKSLTQNCEKRTEARGKAAWKWARNAMKEIFKTPFEQPPTSFRIHPLTVKIQHPHTTFELDKYFCGTTASRKTRQEIAPIYYSAHTPPCHKYWHSKAENSHFRIRKTTQIESSIIRQSMRNVRRNPIRDRFIFFDSIWWVRSHYLGLYYCDIFPSENVFPWHRLWRSVGKKMSKSYYDAGGKPHV